MSPDPEAVLDPLVAEMVTTEGNALSATVVALQAVELDNVAALLLHPLATPAITTAKAATGHFTRHRRVSQLDPLLSLIIQSPRRSPRHPGPKS